MNFSDLSFKHILTVARREFRVTVRRKSFIFMALFMPFMMIVPGAISMMVSAERDAVARENAGETVLAVVDDTGSFAGQESVQGEEPRPGIEIVSIKDAEHRIQKGTIQGYYRIPDTFMDSGEVEYISVPDSQKLKRHYHYEVENWMRRELISHLDDHRLVNRVVEGIHLERLEIVEGNLVPEGNENLRMIRRFIIPYLFAFIFPMMIFTAGGFLVQGVAEEKGNKIVEVLLSVLSADELFLGKLLGLGVAALLQGSVWILTGWAAIIFFAAGVKIISLYSIVVAGAYFITGYLSIGALMLGLGSLGSTPAESQGWSFAVSSFAVIAFIISPSMLEDTNGLLMRLLTWFPLTSPVAVNFRVAFGEPPLWDLGLGFVISLASVFIFTMISARLWKAGMLMRGMAPGMESFRVLAGIVAGKSVDISTKKVDEAKEGRKGQENE